jgi:hypothetical protein
MNDELQKIKKDLEPSVGDYAHTGVRALLSGHPPAEIFSIIVMPPLEKRRNEWMVEIFSRIKELEGEKGKEEFKIENLAKNEVFISMFLYATQVAMRTHQKEKRDALRNAVINSAFPNSLDEDLQLIFLNMIDTFTPWHIRILKFYQDPKRWFKKLGKDPVYNGNPAEALLRAFPDLSSKQSLYEQIINDLNSRGLLSLDKPILYTTVTSPGDLSRTTEVGNAFLQFIESPDEVTNQP